MINLLVNEISRAYYNKRVFIIGSVDDFGSCGCFSFVDLVHLQSTTTATTANTKEYSILSYFDGKYKDRLLDTRLFIFGREFCSLLHVNEAVAGFAMKFIAQMVDIAPENSWFLFQDIHPSLNRFLAKSKHNLHVTSSSNKILMIALKPLMFKLPDSFYSTISYIRSAALQVKQQQQQNSHTSFMQILNEISHDGLLDIGKLMKSSKYSDEWAEMDEASANIYLSLVQRTSQLDVNMGTLESLDLAMKRLILLDWFDSVRPLFSISTSTRD